MKLLVVSNMYPSQAYPSYGVFVKNFCRGLEVSGIDYDLAVMRRGSNKLQKLLGYLSFYAGSFFKSLFGSYDLVYVHYASHSSPAVLLARKLRKFRLFTNLHGSDVVPENPSQEKMQRYTAAAISQSERVIVPSPYFQKLVSEKYGIPMEKTAVCASGGVDTSVFHKHPADSNPVFTLGCVGRISAGKGWGTLLDACRLLERPYRLLIVGDGPERPQLEAKIRQNNLQDHVTLLPLQPQEKLPHIYSSLDAFVFPTERAGESLGLVGLEAMACGVPVICSNYAAPADYVTEGVNGFQFAVGDPNALAEAIYRCMDADLDMLGANAVKTAARYEAREVHQTMKRILTGPK